MAKDATNLAAVLHAKATDLVLEERPVPSPGPGEVLIRNHAVAVNPADWKRQATGMLITSYPLILGAGTVINPTQALPVISSTKVFF